MTTPQLASDGFRIGISRRVYNATLRDAITRSGLTTTATALALRVTYQTLLDWLKFAAYPRDQEVRLRCAVHFGISDDVLFPPEIAEVQVKQQPSDLRLTYAEFRDRAHSWLMLDRDDGDPVLEAERSALASAMAEAMSTLSDKERRVLTLRYGLDGEPVKTLEETGRELGVTRERIRQIEAKALRKLRHPSRSSLVRDWSHYADIDSVSSDIAGRPLKTVAETIRDWEASGVKRDNGDGNG